MAVVTLSMFVFQTIPTDMRALQDFEEEDKLQINMNDVITIIEGRSVCESRTQICCTSQFVSM